MSRSADAAADQTHAMMQDLADHWGLAVVMGVVSIILGLLAMFYPGATIVTVAIFFAAWLFVSGIIEVINSFTRDGDTGARVLHAIIGVLSVIVGFALLRTPFQSVEVFIFVLGIFWLVQGVMTFVAAFSVRQGRNWRIFMGILGVIAGIIILTYPISSALTLAFIGGIWLVILVWSRSSPDSSSGAPGRPDPPVGLTLRGSVLSCRAAPTRRPRRARYRPRPVSRVLAPA
jgi:uncharacterized membrane protein HdeD (DUF308 family)